VPRLKEAGVPNEPDVVSDNTTVFEYTIDHGPVRSAESISIWEQFAMSDLVQRNWADQAVSCTVYHSEAEKPFIATALELWMPHMKGVSMLPHAGHGYAQAPYEPISKEMYEDRSKATSRVKYEGINLTPVGTKFCDGDKCAI
jgi:hypothetical protein